MGRPVSPALALTFLVGAPLLATIIGALKGRTLKGAASAVDTHYKLKDRARTALDFMTKAQPSDLHTLQIEDAEAHLARRSRLATWLRSGCPGLWPTLARS